MYDCEHTNYLKKGWVVLLLLCFTLLGNAQNLDRSLWYFGNNTGLDFRDANKDTGVLPTVISRSNIAYPNGGVVQSLHCGVRLFSTKGDVVTNQNNRVLNGSTGILGSPFVSTPVLSVADKYVCFNYHLFTIFPIQVDSCNCNRGSILFRHRIGYDVNNEEGTIALGALNIPIDTGVTEKMAATYSPQDTTFWLVYRRTETSEIVSYFVSRDTMFPVVNPPAPANLLLDSTGYKGQMKFNEEGGFLAITSFCAANLLEVYRYNTTTGRISLFFREQFEKLPDEDENNCTQGPYGLAFSPDGEKLYVSEIRPDGSRIYQYNLGLSSGNASRNSKTEIYRTPVDSAAFLYAMSAGPPDDGRIYIGAEGQRRIDVILNPDLLWEGCQYTPQLITLGATSIMGRSFTTEGLAGKSFRDACWEPSANDICYGNHVPFRLRNYTFVNSVNWTFDDPRGEPFNTSREFTDEHLYPDTGAYRPFAQVETECASISRVMPINVFYTPPANAGKDLCVERGETVQLRGTGDGGVPVWTPNTFLQDDSVYRAVCTPETSMRYVLSIYNDNCVARDTMDVRIPDIDVYIPNAFTPNGDDKNEVFQPIFTEYNGLIDYKFSIWNRWGDLLMETEDPYYQWDGSKFNGNGNQKSDLYIWKMVYKDCGFNIFNRIGHVTLVR